MSKRKPPPNGTCFLVPLRDGDGYGVGVLARANGMGTAFGYFFGPRVSSAKEIDQGGLVPTDAVLVGLFGDLELLRGNWPVVGLVGDWDPDEWPVRPMGRIDEEAGRAWKTWYDEETLDCVREEEIEPGEARKYPREAMMGAGAVEIRLTKLLA